MKEIFILLKKNLNTRILSLGTIISALSLVLKWTDVLKDISLSRINISILLIVLFLILWNIFNEIQHAKKEIFGITTSAHSPKTIKLVKIGKYLIWLFLFIPLYFLIDTSIVYIKGGWYAKKNCDKKTINLMIANFNRSEGEDIFAGNLFGVLEEKLDGIDTIQLTQLNQYIPEGGHYKDTIKNIFENNCCGTGLLIFGRRNDSEIQSSKSFYCRISSLNFFNKKTNRFETNSRSIIYIKNPDNIEFKIEYQSAAVAEFIFALLHNHAGNYSQSNEDLDSAIRANKNKDNMTFIAVCHLFKGDNAVNEGKLTNAFNEYDAGSKLDPSNAILHYNKGVILNEIGKQEKALAEFTIAHTLNNTFTNPLKDFDSLNKIHQIALKGKTTKNTSDTLHNKTNANYGLSNKDSIVTWKETCFMVEDRNSHKWGVMNNRNDTIVNIIYDGLENFTYKNYDCYIVNYRGKYGAIIHKHVNAVRAGYNIYKIDPIYTMNMAKELSENWMDDNK